MGFSKFYLLLSFLNSAGILGVIHPDGKRRGRGECHSSGALVGLSCIGEDWVGGYCRLRMMLSERKSRN